MSIPSIVCFDLDACLWYPEMYMLSAGSPFRYDQEKGQCIGRRGEVLSLLGETREIFNILRTDKKYQNVKIAIASRCDEPSWARECLGLFEVGDGITLLELIDPKLCEIHGGNKRTHFQSIAQASGVKYEDMLFFDDDSWNISEVSKLGVVSVLTPSGMTMDKWEKGMQMFIESKQKKTKESKK
eukprot:c12559_g1_i1.p1 GENE.c12559_g1_i1~~c12559_g1_i1.p1  ORF type:complete len:184 (-),score=78.63 c12559_g1_i1:31-582(-)